MNHGSGTVVDEDVLEITVSELMRLFRDALVQQYRLAGPLGGRLGQDVHDAWDSLVGATFDSVVRQPIEADHDRPAGELGLPRFNFTVDDVERWSWICFEGSPGSSLVWGVDLMSGSEPRLMIMSLSEDRRVASVQWAESQRFVYVRRVAGSPDQAVSVVHADE